MVSRKKAGTTKKSKAKKTKTKKVEKVRFVHLLDDKCEKKELEDLRKSDAEKNKIIAGKIKKLTFDRRVIEDEIDEAKEKFLQDIDNIFDPVKRKELAERLDMKDEELMENLRSISEYKENQKMLDKISDSWQQAGEDAVTTFSLELEQFFDESVNKYVIQERAIDAEIEEKHPTKPPSEAEELASTLALTTDIYKDAKDGTINIEKLTKLIASQPELLKAGGVEKKLDKLLELVGKQQTNQQTSQQWVAEDLGSISSSVEAVPEPHVSDSVKSALLGIPINSGRGEANKGLNETEAIKDFINDKFKFHYKNISQLFANHSSNNQDDPLDDEEEDFTGKPSSYICRKLVCKPAFKKYAQDHLKKGSTVNDAKVGEAFKISDAYKDIEGLIEWAMEKDVYDPKIPRGKRPKAWKTWYKDRKGKQPYKLTMPSDATWISIREDIYKDKDLRIKKRGRGRP